MYDKKEIVASIIEAANECDEQGLTEFADNLTDIAQRLADNNGWNESSE